MTQAELNRAVAQATGEPVSTVAHMGFSVADPLHVTNDPEPTDRPPHVVDWDEVDAQRCALFPV